ncbi:MAG: hypothetical protein IJ478_07545, partial [Alistipes sp.]|nr:hypothetical protein [Alistipes sp.]
LYALRFLLAAWQNPNEFGFALAPQRRLLRLGITQACALALIAKLSLCSLLFPLSSLLFTLSSCQSWSFIVLFGMKRL